MDLSLTSPLLTAFLTSLLVFISLAEQHRRFVVPPFPTSPPVLVTCKGDSMEVLIRADLFGTGVFVNAGELHLGPADIKGADDPCAAFQIETVSEPEFKIHARLTDCGTQLSFTDQSLVYSNTLVYSPSPSLEGVVWTSPAAIPIDCHYQKRFEVGSAALIPSWIPLVVTASLQKQLDFSLRLMSDDWLFVRGSNVYYLGDVIHMQAAVVMGNHLPLRVYVDSCTATATPNPSSSPRYEFIDHHGCLSDGQVAGSRSLFLTRARDDQLHLILDAFRFHQTAEDLLYLTCYLKAVPASQPVTATHRACSVIDHRWRSADGGDQACNSCDLWERMKNQGQRHLEEGRNTGSLQEWGHPVHLGPLFVLPAEKR
ncbi:zona pellucida sperm-binding protein 3-like [Osmerus mordax]|uniref:zona pellucida sperm-binding protein 3-like n=1 Tax=Osmerus mordax TaxID=8014 RepID=UPI0035103930